MKTKDIRKTLCDTLARAESGELNADDARAIIGLANQLQASLAVECKVAAMKMRLGHQADAIGQLDVTS